MPLGKFYVLHDVPTLQTLDPKNPVPQPMFNKLKIKKKSKILKI